MTTSVEMVTMKEAAERLGVSQTKIWRLVREGVLPAYRNPLDKREKRIPVSALQELLAGTGEPPAPRPTIIGVADLGIQSDEVEDWLRSDWRPC